MHSGRYVVRPSFTYNIQAVTTSSILYLHSYNPHVTAFDAPLIAMKYSIFLVSATEHVNLPVTWID